MHGLKEAWFHIACILRLGCRPYSPRSNAVDLYPRSRQFLTARSAAGQMIRLRNIYVRQGLRTSLT